MSKHRDHGGGLDAAVARYGGEKSDWIDLSTGINPVPYPIRDISPEAWQALPDAAAQDALIQAARAFWDVPHDAAILAAPGASSLIARIPALWPKGHVDIQTPTYNEHAAAFEAHGWTISPDKASVQVAVHPNNPDGRLWDAQEFTAPHVVIDESFCDVCPEESHIARASDGETIILKSFGKFWGLAGLRLGFAIGAPELIDRLNSLIGPWAVSGPALTIGAAALSDLDWADQTRSRLSEDANRMDALLSSKGAKILGGTTLFRLYEVDDARAWQQRLAQGQVWSRIFPYSDKWLRLGLPAPDAWDQLEAALC
ncbi:threonine-phosphate decarboxylase [Celeribacter litoreus]|uniref:threonine-phosphate decarboxylase n=1 Tax=Celeribacter litoreus TaxID=2876714 RepID=UPI001CC98684|nr:threonine-phosphate decarboxylase [Celeribacter litoreus]MCA0042335.1 pyridoxal phosphate-dependent class II aminotransferase [Celeribacter litoreus]